MQPAEVAPFLLVRLWSSSVALRSCNVVLNSVASLLVSPVIDEYLAAERNAPREQEEGDVD